MRPDRIERLDAAVRRYRTARRCMLIGTVAALWKDLAFEWRCSPSWAERQTRRHVRGCANWTAAVRDGLIRERA